MSFAGVLSVPGVSSYSGSNLIFSLLSFFPEFLRLTMHKTMNTITINKSIKLTPAIMIILGPSYSCVSFVLIPSVSVIFDYSSSLLDELSASGSASCSVVGSSSSSISSSSFYVSSIYPLGGSSAIFESG